MQARLTLLALLLPLLALGQTAETVRATSLTAQSGYTDCVVASIDEDPDSPDANWCNVAGANNVTTSVTAAMADPALGNPVAAAGAQEIRVQLRKTNHSTNPTCTVDILENGTLVLDNVISATVSSTTGAVSSASWTFSGFSVANGSGLEVRVDCSTGGGAPGNRASGEVGAIELNLQVNAAGQRRRVVVVGD